MSKGKYASKRAKNSKSLALVLSLVLLITATVGGTLAWLGDKTETVTNTFSTAGIDIELKEHVYDHNTGKLTGVYLAEGETNDDYKMIPGWTIPKDPKVTVLEGSEDCYLFVEVTRKNDFNEFMESAIAEGWEKLSGVTEEVYYKTFDGKTSDVKGTPYSILKDDKVIVKSTIKNDDMKNLTEAQYPSISFTAYAIQLYKDNGVAFDVAEAWGYAKQMVLNSGATPSTPDVDQGGSTD